MSDIVDIYLMDLDRAESDLDRLSTLLDRAETERAGQFRFPRDRRRYIARHGRLRELLSQYVGLSPGSIRFVCNQFGKPSVRDSDLQFNLSHSNDVCLVAVARGQELGCDIEWCDPAFPSAQIARAFFSPAEAGALAELDRDQQLEAFYNCWTRKEAYIKARGYGVSLPLDSFEVSLVPGRPAALLRGCDGWSVQGFEPAAGFQAAVVAKGDDWNLKFHDTRSLAAITF
jgi:4'-phosphopantetheinyl transferase